MLWSDDLKGQLFCTNKATCYMHFFHNLLLLIPNNYVVILSIQLFIVENWIIGFLFLTWDLFSTNLKSLNYKKCKLKFHLFFYNCFKTSVTIFLLIFCVFFFQLLVKPDPKYQFVFSISSCVEPITLAAYLNFIKKILFFYF